LLDDPQIIKSKIAQTVTDSQKIIKYDPENKPGISNLLTIYASLKQISIFESEKLFQKSNYKELKNKVGEEI
ncbi:MAG: tryptophan--tRNA ligase, partial [Spiroplasma sp. Tabriz.8]|nr:tryptophan--tRNA ligase [Spiroplasma sp. Tabriz.8]